MELSKNYHEPTNNSNEAKIKKTKDKSAEGHKELFNIFPELNPEKDSDFILWLKDVKSKDIENLIKNQQLEFDKLKKEYQQSKEYQMEVVVVKK